MYVLDVEYDNYIVVYGCSDSESGYKFEYSAVLSRNVTIYGYDALNIEKTLFINELDSSKFQLIKQGGDCLYKFQPSILWSYSENIFKGFD